MTDILSEILRAAVLAGLMIFLLCAGARRKDLAGRGWNFIVCGFALLLIGSLLDISNNFESLNALVVMGDIQIEAILEKIVGFLGGFVLIALGLVCWIPTVTGVERSQSLAVELRQARDEAVRADTAKSRFLANMSHEIRTPMTAILGFSDILADPGITDEQRENYLAIIRRNGDHLLTIINDILDISKIESGMLELEQLETCVPTLVTEVNTLMNVRASDRDLCLRVNYLSAIPERIRTDPVRLRQILFNLIGNAIKFTHQGKVEVGIDFQAESKQGPVIAFSVRDTGIGMKNATIDRLFEAFAQADSSTTREFGGTGLGLCISKSLIEKLGGEITFECNDHSGS